MAVLGISLGNRTTGIAVVRNKELLECRTLTVRNAKANVHAKTAAHYIRQYKILAVALKVPPATHLTEQLKAILKSVAKALEYHGCMVAYKDSDAIKEANPGIRNTGDLIAFAADAYPLLTPERSRELSNRQKYHHKMFEAVVIAHLHERDGIHKNSP